MSHCLNWLKKYKMKTWLKGGLIGLGIGFIMLLFGYVMMPPSPHSPISWLSQYPLYFLAFLVEKLFGDGFSFFNIVIDIAFLILYFLTGAIIGWIVGKIKPSKSKR